MSYEPIVPCPHCGSALTQSEVQRLERVPAWVDQLASKWEREADEDGSSPDQHDEGGTYVSTLLSVAAELRERAKGAP